jgi:hypothetical protein
MRGGQMGDGKRQTGEEINISQLASGRNMKWPVVARVICPFYRNS